MRHPFLSIVCVLLLAENVFADNEVAPEAGTYIVERVIDGATLKLTNGEEVRLIGLDTSKMGKEATEFLKSRILKSREYWGCEPDCPPPYYEGIDGKEIALEFDVYRKDESGRLLAYIFVDTGIDKKENPKWSNLMYDRMLRTPEEVLYVVKGETWHTFINASMIKSGYASPIATPPNVRYAELFEQLYEEAKENKRGLWE